MKVVALKAHNVNGEKKVRGDEYHVDTGAALRLLESGNVKLADGAKTVEAAIEAAPIVPVESAPTHGTKAKK